MNWKIEVAVSVLSLHATCARIHCLSHGGYLVIMLGTGFAAEGRDFCLDAISREGI